MTKRFGFNLWVLMCALVVSFSLAACSSSEETADDGGENTAGEDVEGDVEKEEQAKNRWAEHEWKFEPVEGGMQENIDTQVGAMMETLPEDKKATMGQAQQELAESGVQDNALKQGDKAPAFNLPATYGVGTSLDALLAKGPAVVVFYRGSWCPLCNMHLGALDQSADEIKAAGGQLVAISPELPENADFSNFEAGFKYPVLSDAGNKVAAEYGLVFTLPESLRPVYREFGIDLTVSNGDESQTLPMASTFVIDTDGTIAWAFVQLDYTQRAEPAHIIAVLEEIKAQKQ